MPKLTALGTGCAYAFYSFPESFLLETKDNKKILFDTGSGGAIMNRLVEAGVDFPFLDIDAVSVSHFHTDHILGLPWLISCRSLAKRNGISSNPHPLDVYAPQQAIDFALEILSHELLVADSVENYATFHAVSAGDEIEIAGHRAQIVESADKHADQVGTIIETESENGNTIKLAYCGDCPMASSSEKALAGVDILIHEAFCAGFEAEQFNLPVTGHSSIEDACLFAERIGAKTLILTHLRDHFRNRREAVYGRAAQGLYSGTLLIPDDLDVFEF